MAVIEKGISFPGMCAVLRVSSLKTLVFFGSPRWVLELRIAGPDGRYNAATGVFDRSGVLRLIDTLSRAIRELDSPVGRDVQAHYTKTIGPGIFVEKGYGGGRVKITLASTTHLFWRTLSREDVVRAIRELSSLPEQVAELSAALRPRK